MAALSKDDVPSLEFFEYLGSLVEQDGEWIGPEDMDSPLVEDAATLTSTDDASTEGLRVEVGEDTEELQ